MEGENDRKKERFQRRVIYFLSIAMGKFIETAIFPLKWEFFANCPRSSAFMILNV